MTPLLWSLILVVVCALMILTSIPVMLTVERRGSAWLSSGR